MSRAADELLAKRPELLDEDRTSPRLIAAISALVRGLEVYHRFSIRGLEKVPGTGCLLVGNHSSGSIQEVLLLVRAWHRKFPGRPARGLVHRIAFQFPFRLLPVAQWLGGLYAHPTVARRALERGEPVLVFPGGDVDATRSVFARDEVHFDGRTGFVAMARAAKVPIVPIAISGSHMAYVVLPGARLLAGLGPRQLFGLKACPVTLGVVGSGAAAVAAALVPPLWPLAVAAFVQMLVPAPTRIEAEVLDPTFVRVDETDAEAAERIRASLEATLRRLAAGRWTPWG